MLPKYIWLATVWYTVLDYCRWILLGHIQQGSYVLNLLEVYSGRGKKPFNKWTVPQFSTAPHEYTSRHLANYLTKCKFRFTFSLLEIRSFLIRTLSMVCKPHQANNFWIMLTSCDFWVSFQKSTSMHTAICWWIPMYLPQALNYPILFFLASRCSSVSLVRGNFEWNLPEKIIAYKMLQTTKLFNLRCQVIGWVVPCQ